jgi:DNA-binding NtrC family response regulator
MANIALYVESTANRLTLKAMLEAEGHRLVERDADCIIADTPARAVFCAREKPTLLLAHANEIADAVAAMRRGVFGYIFVPFQPGEVPVMVQRALHVGVRNESGEAEAWLTVEDAERRHILTTLRRCKQNQAEAARRLGIGRNTLWRKLKQYAADSGENPPIA